MCDKSATIVPAKLELTEAAASAAQAEEDKKVPDPDEAKKKLEELLNESNNK
jgi:hypothetical protein